MKKLFILSSIALLVFLTSCGTNNTPSQDDNSTITPPSQENQEDDTLNQDTSNNDDTDIDQEVQEPLKEDLSGENNAYYPIFNGLETKTFTIHHTSGEATEVSFINSQAKSMKVELSFADDEEANFRLSQIIAPDGTSDGPFGTDVLYNLDQLGGYTLVFNESLMQ